MITTFEVKNVRCNGCATTITKTLQEAGFSEVNVDLSCEPRKVTVDVTDEAQLARFKALLRKLGYPLFSDEDGLIDEASLKVKSFVSCAIGKIN